jgi:hypothetical protein
MDTIINSKSTCPAVKIMFSVADPEWISLPSHLEVMCSLRPFSTTFAIVCQKNGVNGLSLGSMLEYNVGFSFPNSFKF